MGLNTRLDKSRDKIRAYNLTQSCGFGCELVEGKEKQRIEITMGFNVGQSKYMIKVGGKCPIEMNDKIRLLGDTLKATSIKTYYDNINQFQHRQDIKNMSGYTLVMLE
jgi:hypothetical protein